MSQAFHIIIPARMASSRLPGKVLLELGGMTLLERVYRQALKACPKSLTIATDHEDIVTLAQGFGAEVVLTAVTHPSGTDRIAEVVTRGAFSDDDIIVNVQGDEPLINPLLISQVAQALAISTAPVASLCWPIENEAILLNPNVVKVVRDCQHHALYFSRSPIPFHRDGLYPIKQTFRHVGLYAYRKVFLAQWLTWPTCELEGIEALEQLRVLWRGYRMLVEDAIVRPLQDVNTAEDLALVKKLVMGRVV
jgi:3-deoxy-manno-octulosonate cytidylyltransferase (CMP-KDO synthetase)